MRLERQIEKAAFRITELETEQETAAFDTERLLKSTKELEVLLLEKSILEEEWLYVTLSLEN